MLSLKMQMNCLTIRWFGKVRCRKITALGISFLSTREKSNG